MENKQLLKMDGSDSDELKEFELPPTRSRRPRMRRALAEAKASGGGSSLCSFRCCILFVISGVLVGVILLMGWMLLNVQKDIAQIKENLALVQSEEKSDLLQSKNLHKSVSKKMSLIEKDEENIKRLQAKVKLLSSQVKILNNTYIQLKEKHDPSDAPSSSVINDVKLLKKGMADTGGEIKKLSDDSEGAKKTLTLVSKLIKSVRKDVMKLRETVSEWDRSPLPTEPVDTLKPFVPTTSPVDKADNEKKSMRKVTKLLKKLVTGYSELFKNKTDHLTVELKGLKKFVKRLNSTHRINFISLEHDIAVLNNVTKEQKIELKGITTQRESGITSTTNTSSNSKVLIIVKDLLVGLKKHQSLINNLTKRIEKAEQFSESNEEKAKNEPKEVVTAQAITTPAPIPATDAPDVTTKPQVAKDIVTEEQSKYSTEPPAEGTAHITTIAPATIAPTTVPSQNGTDVKLNETRTKPAAVNSTKFSSLGQPIVPETGGPIATAVTKEPLNDTVVTQKPLVHSLPKASPILPTGVNNGTNPLPRVNLTEPFTTSEPAATTPAFNTEELITKEFNGTEAVHEKMFTTVPLTGTLPRQDDESKAVGGPSEAENDESLKLTTRRRKRPIPDNNEDADLTSTYEDSSETRASKRAGNHEGFPDKKERDFPAGDGSFEQDGGFVNAEDGSDQALDSLDDSA